MTVVEAIPEAQLVSAGQRMLRREDRTDRLGYGMYDFEVHQTYRLEDESQIAGEIFEIAFCRLPVANIDPEGDARMFTTVERDLLGQEVREQGL